MQRSLLLLLLLLVATTCRREAPRPAPTTAPTAVALELDKLFETGKRSLVATHVLKNADGKRVRLTGYMAQMELPPVDGFYLVRRPVHCDEAGGGTADLPPDAIRVVVAKGMDAIGFTPGPVEVEGRLELGRKEHPDGTVSQVRLIMSGDAAPSAPGAQNATATLTGG